jgi:hypothetical protein
MDEPQKQTLLDVDPKKAQPTAKISQPKIRSLTVFTIIATVLGLIAAAEIFWWLSTK